LPPPTSTSDDLDVLPISLAGTATPSSSASNSSLRALRLKKVYMVKIRSELWFYVKIFDRDEKRDSKHRLWTRRSLFAFPSNVKRFWTHLFFQEELCNSFLGGVERMQMALPLSDTFRMPSVAFEQWNECVHQFYRPLK
jgi:hypothetical protein